MFVQAQKRKLGLLEDDDISKLANAGEGMSTDDSTTFGKNRGMLILRWRMFSGRKYKNIFT